jgi:putative Mg2+ transporter-C (MgtC) family protein
LTPEEFHWLGVARGVLRTKLMESITIPADNWALAWRLALAALLGGILGLNREMAFKPAGMRTHALVALGAALATITGLALTLEPSEDPSATGRIIQGIVAGIGFVGSGVILHRRDNHTVEGLTTAASIWVIAATGVAVGAGLWRASTLVVLIALVLLVVGSPIDRFVQRLSRRQDQE